MTKVWFVTGSSRGFGRRFVEAALDRGDKVAATARSIAAIEELSPRYGDRVLPIELDVVDRPAVERAVGEAHSHFGRLDVVVNNAGFGLFGAIEEVDEAQARAQLETNFFGALWVTQAALPLMREQRAGRIVQISSLGGVLAMPYLGIYNASKWALEGFSEALAGEVAPYGIHVTLVEPGGYATDWGGASAVLAEELPAYDDLRRRREERRAGATFADPAAAAEALLRVVDAPEPPLRVLFGSEGVEWVRDAYRRRLESWDSWADVSVAAESGGGRRPAVASKGDGR